MRAFSTPTAAALLAAFVVSPAFAAPAPAPAHKSPAAATAAAPAASPTTADVRCLMTMIALGQDKTRTQIAQLGAYFFYGRINARAPGLDLGAAMRAEAPKMDGATLQAELQRCGPMIQSSSQSLQNAVNSLRPPGSPPPGAASTPAPAARAPAPAAPPVTQTPK